MNQDLQLQLQAYLDGELPAADRTAVESLLAQDAEARALITELRHTTLALVGYEATIKLPESREFYWSKIQRAIDRQPAMPAPAGFSLSAWLRRLLIPAGAFAAIALAMLMTLPKPAGPGAGFTEATDAGAFTYQNYDTGTTLVWLDYSAENALSDSDSDDTLDF